MNLEEANRVIAKFMNHPRDLYNIDNELHYESLDALVPVWDKLREEYGTENCLYDYNGDPWSCTIEIYEQEQFGDCVLLVEHSSATPQEAACITTASVIKELFNE
jgi:hypothetical protein